MIKKLLMLIRVIVMISTVVFLILGKMAITFNLVITLLLLFLECGIKKWLLYTEYLELLIYIFILGTQILGEIFYFYVNVNFFDVIMHGLSGFIVASMGGYLLKKINDNSKDILVILFVFFFSMGISAIWELTEFSLDRLFYSDMQKDTIVTSITSFKFSTLKKRPTTKIVEKATINDIDLIKDYGGYIDIGLYDTMGDMFSALIGTFLYILIHKKNDAI